MWYQLSTWLADMIRLPAAKAPEVLANGPETRRIKGPAQISSRTQPNLTRDAIKTSRMPIVHCLPLPLPLNPISELPQRNMSAKRKCY